MVQVVQDLMTILKSMGVSCVQYLKHFLPPLVLLMEVHGDNTPGLCEIIFQQLGKYKAVETPRLMFYRRYGVDIEALCQAIC
jgi:hypothetical protein